MVNKCCVPHCRGNYVGGEKVSVFRFPDDELLKMKWTRSIHRSNFTPTTYSRVCIKHFMSEDVLWETSMFDESTGKVITVKLPAPRLRKGVPSVFPERPSCTSVKARLEPEEKKEGNGATGEVH
ncbi:THAP domain-containing protein 2-like [Ischnura elegans]|uniref:THAP domain-containing protein 2-like n=1 Tax=Ischnura elegans TaxID=197161 RepID=UPI001ED87588|nr:THAP domain-containing protein 2-like [Ischnura elegans]